MKGNKIGWVGKLLSSALALCWAVKVANATDTLSVYNNFGLVDEAQVRVQHKVGSLEGFDSLNDSQYIPIPSGSLGIYSEIINPLYKLARDARPTDSNTPFNLKLVYEGFLENCKQNNLKFAFGTESFGTQTIIYDSNNLKFGKRVNVRNAIDNQVDPNKGRVDMKDLVAGTYTASSPYATGTLTIGTEPLAELTKDDLVDMKDFSVIANDWGKTGEGLAGDIYGPKGIPDGKVDFYDLMAFGNDYLK